MKIKTIFVQSVLAVLLPLFFAFGCATPRQESIFLKQGGSYLGSVPFPVQDPGAGKRYVQAEIKIEEDVLRETAQITGGSYARVENERELTKSLQQIKEWSPPK